MLEESLDTSLAEISRMKKMIEELLNLARREKIDPHSRANINTILTSVVEELKVVHPTALFTESSVGQQKDVFMSEQALAQVLRNLLENGIRYNAQVPRLHTTIHYEIENVFVQIEDNGIGIAEEHLPHIFDRFYRVDEARGQIGGGTGLGLSITKMLAEKYNIELSVTSKTGNGTTFLLRFPQKNAQF